ncbi:MAG TPA: redoxin domain-containing protein [Draconibacterium sp.]|nr:redoxin domain-containing protein [Draconibacterium sp.]
MKRLMFTSLACILALGIAFAADNKIPLIGSKAPKFTANSTNGKITFPNDFGSSWKILFSHPADFTPVCTSELLELANLQPEFEKLGVKVAVISTDDVAMHKLWKEHLQGLDYKDRGHLSINFPILEDPEGKTSRQYGMLHEPVSTVRDVRGVFIIDDKNVIRSVNFNPVEVGRNMEEYVRMVEALKLTDREEVYTPANWMEGDDVIVPFFPYTNEQLANDPELESNYYQVGNRLWFKRGTNSSVEK